MKELFQTFVSPENFPDYPADTLINQRSLQRQARPPRLQSPSKPVQNTNIKKLIQDYK